jgi:hypothetical protein
MREMSCASAEVELAKLLGTSVSGEVYIKWFLISRFLLGSDLSRG